MSEHAPEHVGQAGAGAAAARALAIIPPPPPPVPPGGRPTRPHEPRVGTAAGGSSGASRPHEPSVGTAAGGSSGASRASPQLPQGPTPRAPTGGTIAPAATAQTGASPITVCGDARTTAPPGMPTPRKPGLPGDTSADAGAASADGGEHSDGVGGLGAPAAAGTHPITVGADDRVETTTDHGGAPADHPVAAAPHDDDGPDGSDMEEDAAAPPSASARSDTPPPVDDGTGPAPKSAVEGATPAHGAIRGDGSDDVVMESDDNPGLPPAPSGDTGPSDSHGEDEDGLAADGHSSAEDSREEDEDGLAADGRSSAEDSHGDAVMPDAEEQGDGRVVAVAGQPECAFAGVGAAADGDAPPPTPRPGSGLDRAFLKAARLGRLTTQDDYIAKNTLRQVYSTTKFLARPGGPMADLLIDQSVGYSVKVPQAIAALEDVEGLMAAVRAANADDLLALFVKAALHDLLVPGVLGEHTTTDGTSPSAPSTH